MERLGLDEPAELIDEWDTWLKEQGISDRVRRRKINHLENFAYLRDFYRFQESRGRIQDLRFAELIYGVRDMIAERVELYDSLNPADADFDDLFEQLFFG